MRKANGLQRRELSDKTVKVTAFFDVHDSLLYYAVVGFTQQGDPHVVDYGTFPDQGGRTSACARRGGRWDERIRAQERNPRSSKGSLPPFRTSCPGRSTPRVGMRSRSRWRLWTAVLPEIVFQAIRIIGRLEDVRPSVGRGITASSKPFVEYDLKRNRATGLHWWIPKESKPGVVNIDVNWWKNLVAIASGRRWATRRHDALGKQHEHRMLADHIAASTRCGHKAAAGAGRMEAEAGMDNHLWDCVVGCFAAASCAA